MIVRKLEQDVLNLEDYIEQNYKYAPAKDGSGKALSKEQRKALFGARMVGRFKTVIVSSCTVSYPIACSHASLQGAPLALTPYRDDVNFTKPELINNFDYTEGNDIDHPNRAPNCPFAAHIRKTVPRNLDPLIQKEYLDASMIVRTGIPYGPEVRPSLWSINECMDIVVELITS